jgi:RNA polymerase sigma-70 factor (ECF subfamily)
MWMHSEGVPFMATALPQMASAPRYENEDNDGLSVFANVRQRLLGIAYRMLGSKAEAEDIVQDVWLRWQFTNRSDVQNPAAYLATTTTRLCINQMQSAHRRRETYIGTWLPEPLDTGGDPMAGSERGEALKLAVLIVLEKLTPTERAAYVLREAFEYAYERIAEILHLQEANVRQLVSRARKRVTDGRRVFASSSDHRRLLEAFIAAANTGDMAALESIFVEHLSTSAGAGDVARTAEFHFAVASASQSSSSMSLPICWNGMA